MSIDRIRATGREILSASPDFPAWVLPRNREKAETKLSERQYLRQCAALFKLSMVDDLPIWIKNAEQEDFDSIIKFIEACLAGLQENYLQKWRQGVLDSGHKLVAVELSLLFLAKSDIKDPRKYLMEKASLLKTAEENLSLRERVYAVTRQIPRGKVATYMQIAKLAGNPKAIRAVGMYMASNPDIPRTPCHRVVASDGKLTGYSAGAGLFTKREMLLAEGVEFIRDRVDLSKSQWQPTDSF